MFRKLNNSEIKKLPTLIQLVQSLKIKNKVLVEQYDGWNNHPALKCIPTDACWHSPMMDFRNSAEDNKYIVVQTIHGRHTLKPNLREHHFIYRGQNAEFPFIISSFSRDDYLCSINKIDKQELRDRHVVNNLKCEDFISLLRTHPLFVLLDRGIHLENEKRTLFFNMNYYGLAQHYNFKSAVVDFTRDIDIAAFFACTKNIGHDQSEPIGSNGGYGVLYVHEIKPNYTFKLLGFSTIGMQIYPRSGVQKGLLFNEGKQLIPLNELVWAYRFRHDTYSSKHFYKLMEGGKKLFPQDRLSIYADDILNSQEITGYTFASNLYSNQDEFINNIESVERKNMHVNWQKQHHFTPEMLRPLYNDIKNGLWEDFCKNIYFADSKKGKLLHEELLRLPSNPNYSHYFIENEYKRIFEYDCDKHERAIKNRRS